MGVHWVQWSWQNPLLFCILLMKLIDDCINDGMICEVGVGDASRPLRKEKHRKVEVKKRRRQRQRSKGEGKRKRGRKEAASSC